MKCGDHILTSCQLSEQWVWRVLYFWDMKLCKLIDIYWYFGAICSLHLQLQMVAADCTPTSIHIYQITWHKIPEYREFHMSLVVISIYCALSASSTTDEISFLFQAIVLLVCVFTNLAHCSFFYDRCLKHVILWARYACSISYQLLKIKISISNGRIQVFK